MEHIRAGVIRLLEVGFGAFGGGHGVNVPFRPMIVCLELSARFEAENSNFSQISKLNNEWLEPTRMNPTDFFQNTAPV